MNDPEERDQPVLEMPSGCFDNQGRLILSSSKVHLTVVSTYQSSTQKSPMTMSNILEDKLKHESWMHSGVDLSNDAKIKAKVED